MKAVRIEIFRFQLAICFSLHYYSPSYLQILADDTTSQSSIFNYYDGCIRFFIVFAAQIMGALQYRQLFYLFIIKLA